MLMLVYNTLLKIIVRVTILSCDTIPLSDSSNKSYNMKALPQANSDFT